MIMKTSTVFAVLLFSILSISCQKNENVETPAAEPVVDIRDSLVEAGWKRGRYVVSYGIDNPVPDGTLYTDPFPEWIENVECNEGSLIFTVGTNISSDKREAEIVLVYGFGEGLAKTGTVRIVQEASGFEADRVFMASVAVGNYYAERYSASHTEQNYFTYLSDAAYDELGFLVKGATYYAFDIFSDVRATDVFSIAAPEGTYSLGIPGETGVGTFSATGSYWITIGNGEYNFPEDCVDFKSGFLDIHAEDGEWVYEAFVEDVDGGKHYVCYKGTVELDNFSAGPDVGHNSSLLSDYDADLSGAVCEASCLGGTYGEGLSTWVLTVYPEDYRGDIVNIEIVAGDNFTPWEDGLPTGKYSGSGVPASGSYIMDKSSLTIVDANGRTRASGCFREGSVILSLMENGVYSIEFDCLDDNRPAYRMTGKWEGVPVVKY